VTRAGVVYEARACGSEMADGMWQGWIEFVPLESGEPVRTPRETTQPNHADLRYWATGLTPVYLEGALERALGEPRIVEETTLPQAIFDEPAPSQVKVPPAGGTSVLDPFSVYEKGEALLRKQLQALSAWHLVNIIQEYDLSQSDPTVLNRTPAAALIDLIVASVRARSTDVAPFKSR
jgi:hypothetical protein